MVCSEGNEGGVEEAEGLILMGGTCGWGWYVNDMQAFEDWKVEVCIHVFECARFRLPPPTLHKIFSSRVSDHVMVKQVRCTS